MKKFIALFFVLFVFSFVGVNKKAEALSCVPPLPYGYYASYEQNQFINGFQVIQENVEDYQDSHESCGFTKETIIEVTDKNKINDYFVNAVKIASESQYLNDEVLDSGIYTIDCTDAFCEQSDPSYLYKIDDNPNNLEKLKLEIIDRQEKGLKEIEVEIYNKNIRDVFFNIAYFIILIILIANAYYFIKKMRHVEFLGKAVFKNILLQIFLTFFFLIAHLFLMVIAIILANLFESQIDNLYKLTKLIKVDHDIFNMMILLTPLIILIEIIYYIVIKIKRNRKRETDLTIPSPNPDK